MKGSVSQGVCQLCKQTFAKSAMTRHLERCLPAHDPSRGGKRALFHLLIDGYGPYWLHVEMPGKATFGHLDAFLRKIWLECCGHMSAFRMNEDLLRGLDPDSDFEFPEDALMDCEIAEVLEPKLAFGYEYDFGSTTELRLRVVGMRTGAWSGSGQVHLLARNLPPEEKCSQCGQPAVWIDTDSGDTLCAKCAANADDPEMLLPVVNSPRMGVCGYTGDGG